MKQELLHHKLSVLEVFAKVNQSGHKCNTEIKELIESITKTLDEVELEIIESHEKDSDEEEGYEDEL